MLAAEVADGQADAICEGQVLQDLIELQQCGYSTAWPRPGNSAVSKGEETCPMPLSRRRGALASVDRLYKLMNDDGRSQAQLAPRISPEAALQYTQRGPGNLCIVRRRAFLPTKP